MNIAEEIFEKVVRAHMAIRLAQLERDVLLSQLEGLGLVGNMPERADAEARDRVSNGKRL